ncbi:hypothetical protein RFI_12430 [Reticulomyxa filosa]|uniref:Uncharacterized protein n=1 Tax=Reticulomyxa filosa TaxID=46433 RepID=X6NH97_RETFI|nr:hypothetical protein RFI_12430 [Reticulomyxa filosa]|eukprot:ETO24727.1 hypothetical protein RFI_12430 [Reticulomyxa filosa]
MSDSKEEYSLEDDIHFERKLEAVVVSDADSSYYKNANAIVDTVLNGHSEMTKDYKIYGAILSGCVQKQLAVRGVSCGYLVFFYHLDERDLNENDLASLEMRHYTALKKIEAYIREAKKKRINDDDDIEILGRSRSLLRIKWKGLKYHIAITWTFSKREYCSFDKSSQNNGYVYPLSQMGLRFIANDLMTEAQAYERHLKNVRRAHRQWKTFFQESMNASLSLLRVYYMREELVGKNTRLAVLFLRLWQHVAMKDKRHLSNNSLEIICTSLSNQLKLAHQSNAPVLALDIIQHFFQLIVQCRKCTNKPTVIAWPYESRSTSRHIQKCERRVRPGRVVVLDNLVAMS